MNKSQYIFTCLISSLLMFASISCNNTPVQTYEVTDTKPIPPLEINTDSIKIVGETGNFSVEKTIFNPEEGVKLITFSFTAKTPSELTPVSIQFHFPSIDIMGFWNPSMSADKVNFYSSGITSKATRYAPILSFYNNALHNRITISLSDALNKSEIVSYLKEEDVSFHPKISLFKEKMPLTKNYSITLRIDTRSLPYYESIDDVATWWAKKPEYKPLNVPEDAKKPMYSTWYSYHQNISMDEIVNECKIARSLGCDAVIVDDGWQTVDGNRGYRYTGDWYPERIPNMVDFVQAVHNEDMKLLLWYSLPFIGEKAKNYPRFIGKYLRYWESQGAYILDPRYPEVREFIINTYMTALNNWNLDGFKLDFMGWFTASEDTQLTEENGRDYASVNDATDALMTEITERLTAARPNILIEFRQPYIGPLMRKYGNMFRGVDCPNNAVANRLETTNLRILSQNTAVHSDMFIWRHEESVEQAALQILNILYSVPQLSVKLGEVPDSHLDMIRYWFAYWNNNSHILLGGTFIPSNPGANYPVLTAINKNHQITTTYEDMIVSIGSEINQLDIINAKNTTRVVVDFKSSFHGMLVVNDCTGNLITKQSVSFKKGVNRIDIPQSGIALLRKASNN